MERMQIVIAGSPDLPERRFQFLGTVQRRAITERKGRHPAQAHRVQSTISVPSAGVWEPARSPALRSAESFSSAGVGMLIFIDILPPRFIPATALVGPLWSR